MCRYAVVLFARALAWNRGSHFRGVVGVGFFLEKSPTGKDGQILVMLRDAKRAWRIVGEVGCEIVEEGRARAVGGRVATSIAKSKPGC